MLTTIFWNIKGVGAEPGNERYQELSNLLQQMAAEYKPEVLILAESPFNEELALEGFISAPALVPANKNTGCRLEIYYRNKTIQLVQRGGISRATIQELTNKATGNSMLLVAVHLPGMDRAEGEETRKEMVRILASEIRKIEEEVGHQRTVLMGDLNYNPFDLPVFGFHYLHAVPTKVIARGRERAVSKEKRPFFYNPMWSFWGDKDNQVPGTYYRRSNTVDCRFWHILDQVLIRPELLAHWDHGSEVINGNLRILTRVGEVVENTLIKTKGQPTVSDHLPIFFQLAL